MSRSIDQEGARRAQFDRAQRVTCALLIVSSVIGAFDEFFKPWDAVAWADLVLGLLGFLTALVTLALNARGARQAAAWVLMVASALVCGAGPLFITYPSSLLVGGCGLAVWTALPENIFPRRVPSAPWALIAGALYAASTGARIWIEGIEALAIRPSSIPFVVAIPPVIFIALRALIRRTLGEQRLAIERGEALAAELRRLNVELSASRAKAEAASEAKSRFLANMSHELRTPLNAIIGYAELLSEGEQLEAQAREDLERIRASGRHLLGMISDVLDVARIESGQIEIEDCAVDLGAIARRVAESTRGLVEAGGNALVFECAPVIAAADEGKFAQIVYNLVANAAKFTRDGTITVAALDGEQWAVEVRDTGPGIAPEQRERIFERFTQLDDSPTRRRGGAGLGLSISAQLAERMGMRLELESELGRGCVFRLVPSERPRADAPRLLEERQASALA